MGVEILQLVYNQDSLGSISKLDEGLKDATSIVLVSQFGILLSDGIYAFLDNLVFLFTRHFLLLHEEAIVGDLKAESGARG